MFRGLAGERSRDVGIDVILVYHPLRRGDRVSVTGVRGDVADIDLRYTTVRLDDGRTALIPNSSIFSNPLVVRKSRRSRRGITRSSPCARRS